MADVSLLEKVCRLEDFLLGQTVGLGGGLEPLDVLHELEVGSLRLDLLDGSRSQFVDQVAEDNAVSEDVLEVPGGDWFANAGENPVKDFRFEILVAFLQIVHVLVIRLFGGKGRICALNLEGI